MGRKPTGTQSGLGTHTDHASRVRDNKRRHRARHKEYVLDLERRVAEARQQGVQATKEVQLAARQVAQENAKLRLLLKRIGYTECTINAWVKEGKDMHSEERHQLIPDSTPGKSAPKVLSTCALQSGTGLEAGNVSEKEVDWETMKSDESGESSTRNPPPEPSIQKLDTAPTDGCLETLTRGAPVLSGHPNTTGAPCKLVTLLTKNPATDITQVPLSTQSNYEPCETGKPEDCGSDGVECSSAYKMLMQYATSDEKMDRIAVALESGCTPSAQGGCKVKKSVVWKVLDEECT